MGGVSNPFVNTQVQTVDTTAALAGSATFTSATKDMESWESLSISVFIQRDTIDTNIDVFVENSSDGITWRQQDAVNLAVTALQTTQTLNRVYSATRVFMRVRLVNNTVNALLATELTTIQKTIS